MEPGERISLKYASGAATYEAVVALDGQVRRVASAAALSEPLVELVRIRVSQLNGCAFCLRMHTADALAGGKATDRIAVLAAWRETSYFSGAERAALALAEAVTRLVDRPVPHEVKQAAVDALGAEGAAATVWIAIAMNAWNRIAVAGRYPVGPEG